MFSKITQKKNGNIHKKFDIHYYAPNEMKKYEIDRKKNLRKNYVEHRTQDTELAEDRHNMNESQEMSFPPSRTEKQYGDFKTCKFWRNLHLKK